MKPVRKIVVLFLLAAGLTAFAVQSSDGEIISYNVNLQKQDLRLYRKNDSGKIIGSIQNLKTYVGSKNQTLIFATNGGMYQENQSPLGLFVQNRKTVAPLNKRDAGGNFYLKPNGVFYITGKTASIVTTENFRTEAKIDYATQSGPMLVIDGEIHPAFKFEKPEHPQRRRHFTRRKSGVRDVENRSQLL